MYVSGQIHAPASFPPGERVSITHLIVDCLEPWAGLDAVAEKKSLFLPRI
jgi:hypothetical protein